MFFNNFLTDLPGTPRLQSHIACDTRPGQDKKGARLTYVPNDAMRVLHARFLSYLRKLDDIPYARGARPGLGPRSSAELHRRNRFFYSVSLEAAFDAVEGTALAEMLCVLNPYLGDPAEVHEFLGRFFLDPRGRLLMDVPASPELLNVYLAMRIDKRFCEYAARYGLLYSRYRCDLTFSSQRQIGWQSRKMIRAIVKDAGFRVNHCKFRSCDIRKRPTLIAGVELRSGGRIRVSQPNSTRVSVAMERAVRRGGMPIPKAPGVIESVWATRFPSLSGAAEERRIIESYLEFKDALDPS